MRNAHVMGLTCALLANLCLSTHTSFAAVTGKTFGLTISSTQTGTTSGYITFNQDGTYNYTGPEGSWGYGTYVETVDDLTGTSAIQGSGIGNDGYYCLFVGQSTNITLGGMLPLTTVFALGISNRGELFLAVGYALNSGSTSASTDPADSTPSTRRPQRRSP